VTALGLSAIKNPSPRGLLAIARANG
jgi:hypothetical protein